MQIFRLQKAGMEKHERLVSARERHFPTAKAAAESLGVPYGSYSGHESGTRGFQGDRLALYARRFHVPIAWLAFGQGSIDDPVNEVGPAGTAGFPAPIARMDTSSSSAPLHRTYIQVELLALRDVLSGALQNESIPEAQADAYADAVVELLRERSTPSLVLRLEDASRSVAGFPEPEPDDRS